MQQNSQKILNTFEEIHNSPTIYIQHDINKNYKEKVTVIDDNYTLYNQVICNQKNKDTNPNITSIASHQYSCKITEVFNDEKFEAKAINLKNENDVIFLTFPFDEVDECDREFIQLGAIFMFSIGKQRVSGSLEKYEKIIFQRTPGYSKSFISKINNLEVIIDDLFD